MSTYLINLKKHKRLTSEDIVSFVNDQVRELNIESYVKKINFGDVFAGIASYSSGKVTVDDEIRKYYYMTVLYQKEETVLKKIRSVITSLSNDCYNLYIINTVLHELFHAVQEKEMSENASSSLSLLMKIAYQTMSKSGSTYNYFHDRYYQEYHANINAALHTLKFIEEKCQGVFSASSLMFINKQFAEHILNGYGISEDKYLKHETYSSPMEFCNFYFDEFDFEDEALTGKLKIYLQSYKDFPTNDFESLINGYNLSKEGIDILKMIRYGKIQTADLFQTIKEKTKNDYKEIK